LLQTPQQTGSDKGRIVLDGPLLGLVTRRMELLSDPTRVRLILALENGEASVQRLADELGVSHKSASQGLNVLYREGIVARRRQGVLMVYALSDYSMCHLISKATEGTAARIEELNELITS
jgi:DNA-binding transcriptional ArsR family regulator